MTDNLPSEGLVRTILATVAPGRYIKLVERETEADRSKLISEALAKAEIQAAQTGNIEDRQAVKNLRLLCIANKAAENTRPDANPKKLAPDFREHFRSRAENITSEDMQGFMAKLLGSELSTPGTISKRAVNVVADMDRRDAELLVNLRKFVWALGNSIQTIILDMHRNRPLYEDNGINVETLNTLQGMGLLEYQTISNYELMAEGESLEIATYHSKDRNVEIDGVGTYRHWSCAFDGYRKTNTGPCRCR